MKVAILSAKGIGDAFLMMIPAHQFQKKGHDVAVFHDQFEKIAPLFPHLKIFPYPPLSAFLETLKEFDHILLENDHSDRALHCFQWREKCLLPPLCAFFPKPSKKIRPDDFFFHKNMPFSQHIALVTQMLLKLENPSQDNGLKIPSNKMHRKDRKRIVIHPTSKDPKCSWYPKQFLLFAHHLKKEGYSPAFIVTTEEREKWHFIEKEGFSLMHFSHLSDLAEFIFESGFFVGNDSGPGHLASNLKIPTLTISGNPRLALWRPGWTFGKIAKPFFPLPNFKGFRIRENYWQLFVTQRHVRKKFDLLINYGS